MNNCDHNSGCCVYVSLFGLMQCSSSTYRTQEETWKTFECFKLSQYILVLMQNLNGSSSLNL